MRSRRNNEAQALFADQEFRRAYAEHERQSRLETGRVGCLLVMALMPAGVALDMFVYTEHWWPEFLWLRLGCSLAMLPIFLLHRPERGIMELRVLQQFILLLPALCINWMVFKSGNPDSPYYAGLNLLLLAISAVAHWRVADSVIAVFNISLLYLGLSYLMPEVGATLPKGGVLTVEKNLFINNIYFLLLTGVIVVVGNLVFNRVAFQEFVSRFQLARKERELAQKNREIADQNTVLERNQAELREMNREIAHKNTELVQHQNELEQKNREIAQKNADLIEMDKVRTHFFGNISHELRTPLTLLLAPLQGLLNDPGRRWDHQTRVWLQLMHDKALQLLKLINDLLALQRLDAGKMTVQREPLALPEFVGKLGESVSPVAQNKHVQLTTCCDPELSVVLADREKLEQILVNLLFNAVKFTPAGGRVALRVVAQDQELRLEVSDTGVGIERERLQYLGTRFWQADGSASRKYQGVGIGLALVKELVEIQGGHLTVESEVGQGTTVGIRLPLLVPSGEVAAPKPVAPVKPGDTEWLVDLYRQARYAAPVNPIESSMRPFESPSRTDRPKLLIADDEPDMLAFINSLFCDEYTVLEATDGQQALDKATQMLPDVIVCDWMMPEKDGLQVCQALRDRLPTKEIPILLLTARADEETKLQGLAAGASDFLTKPFSPSELRLRVQQLSRTYLLQRQLRRTNQELESANDDLHTTNRELEEALERVQKAQAELVKQEKMASLGRFSAGIMHELNNPLTFISTGLFVLRSRCNALPQTERGEFDQTLDDMKTGLDSVQAIVQNVRHFAHPSASMCQEVPVAEIVKTTLSFLAHDLKEGIRVEPRLAEGHVVHGNRNQLVQVLTNLVQNAADALRKQPAAGAREGPTIRIESHAGPRWDRITVRDNGPGIPPALLDRVFDPFFTTKDVGEGTGLGLSICHGIVQAHRGRITVRSEPGEFCEFTIELPHEHNGHSTSANSVTETSYGHQV